MSRLKLELVRRVKSWTPATVEIECWASSALAVRGTNRQISISIVGAREIRRLNAKYRQRDTATNVLSFPAPRLFAPLLGDIVICPEVLRREAVLQCKSLRAHWAHLVIHGALHLIGYDHQRRTDATRMERRETILLKRLGFANPYV
jgi:probable rRNA maturation factor